MAFAQGRCLQKVAHGLGGEGCRVRRGVPFAIDHKKSLRKQAPRQHAVAVGGGATEDLRLPACGAQPGQTTGGIAGAGSGPVQQTAGQGHAVGVFFRLLEAAQGGIAQVQVAHAGDARFASAVGRGKDDLVAGGAARAAAS